MDVNFELGDYKFEWDSEKAEKNFRKHGIKFEDAALVFFDENKIDDFDEIHSDFEERYKIIGRVKKNFGCGLYRARRKKSNNFCASCRQG